MAAGLGYVYVSDRNAAGDSLKIYGSVDMRTVDLAFEESGRIGQVLVEEGDTVKTGDVLAKLDDERYAIALDNARATLEVRQKELDLLLAGSRVEEIDAARATYKANAASAALAQRICKREQKLGQATTEQMVDQACSQARVSQAQALASKRILICCLQERVSNRLMWREPMWRWPRPALTMPLVRCAIANSRHLPTALCAVASKKKATWSLLPLQFMRSR